MTNDNRVAHPLSLSGVIDIRYLRLGLPMWFLPEWKGGLIRADSSAANALQDYASVFGSVEGNTTFYALPAPERAAHWLSLTPDDFRFSFKVPKSISHSANIYQALLKDTAFLPFLEVVARRCGLVMLQLPPNFTPDRLTELEQFIVEFTKLTAVPLAVEFRHIAFFSKGPAESAALRLLADLNCDRVNFDSRGLFADTAQLPQISEAQAKKPRMPVHPISTGDNPVVRFIGHSDWALNEHYWKQWGEKLVEWTQQKKTCWVFIHTATNRDAPALARHISRRWGIELPPEPGTSAQTADLFADD
ncbi:DUF72 domain-containing protein [Thalassolituus sp. LLYu03]|uniref:DUF72 domain-containing protein n=1 Tax=Thalassolituus sp. LLYu03 TaxID=3421656 RepID=UPI003D2BF887